MKLSSFLAAVVCAVVVGSAHAGDDEVMKKAQASFKPVPDTPAALKGKSFTPAKIELGRVLFFDPRLSASMLISCNTCHNVGMGGADFQETSVGHRWQKGPRNAPTVLNSVFNFAQFWDGRAEDLKQQAKGPVQASVEMNNTPEKTMQTIRSMPGYVDLFNKAFPGNQAALTFDNMADAIEAFEATLVTPGARFDHYLRGNPNALTAPEKEGLALFISKGCASCHAGVNMGGAGYFPFGVVEKPREEILAGDVGRFKVTRSKGDEYVFKAPSLRNVDLTPPYFHSGKVWDLNEAVRIMGSAQLGARLTSSEVDLIHAFLKTTTGVQPKIEYPILPEPSGDTHRPKLD
jgi:cytochrome c peroxidase